MVETCVEGIQESRVLRVGPFLRGDSCLLAVAANWDPFRQPFERDCVVVVVDRNRVAVVVVSRTGDDDWLVVHPPSWDCPRRKQQELYLVVVVVDSTKYGLDDGR